MSGIALENTFVYPPGLPLMIVPLIKVFGLDLRILKMLMVASWYLSIVCLFLLFRDKSRRLALMAAVFLASSSFFFLFRQNVISDVPFFLYVCLSLYAFERWNNSPKGQENLFFTAFLFSISGALWTRSAGVTLFIAPLFYFILIKRDIKRWLTVLMVFLANEMVLFFWMGWQPGISAAVWQMPGIVLHHISSNFSVVFQSLWFFFCPVQSIFSQILFNFINPLVRLAAVFIYSAMLWSFIHGWRKRDLSYLECFSFIYLSFFIFWSGITPPSPPEPFTRYVLPLLPFTFICIWRLFLFLKERQINLSGCLRVIFLVLLLMNVTNIVVNWEHNTDVLNLRETRELVYWVDQNMKPNEHYMFSNPRALALLTKRVGTFPWITIDQNSRFIQRVKDLKIAYVFSIRHNDSLGLTAQLEKSNQFRLVWENSAYVVFKFIP